MFSIYSVSRILFTIYFFRSQIMMSQQIGAQIRIKLRLVVIPTALLSIKRRAISL